MFWAAPLAGMLLFGEKNYAGSAHPDTRTGLYANALYLRTNLIEPTNTGDGTRTATARSPCTPVRGSGWRAWRSSYGSPLRVMCSTCSCAQCMKVADPSV